jgi:GDP-4-dehydro-6-deoxy-D-mannose reductase
MRVLITGITGFIGSHLAELLLGEGCTVWGTLFDRCELPNITGIIDRLSLIECDIRDADAVENTIAQARPDLVFHLAAYMGGRSTQDHKELALQVNVLGTVHLLEAVRTTTPSAAVVIPVSSAVFGTPEDPQSPVTEETLYRPVNAYGASKAAQAMLAYQYGQTYRMNVIRLHTFNCIGPRQSDRFACSNFAHQIAEIEKGLRPPVIQVGDLDAYRDFTDVRDVAQAYWLAAERGRPGEAYNVCSGIAYRIGDALVELIRLSDCSIEIRRQQHAGRAAVPYQVGDNNKFGKLTGWRPAVAVKKSLADALYYWRARVSEHVSSKAYPLSAHSTIHPQGAKPEADDAAERPDLPGSANLERSRSGKELP